MRKECISVIIIITRKTWQLNTQQHRLGFELALFGWTVRRWGFLQVGVGQLELRDKISWSQNLLKAGLGVRGVAGVPVRKSENWKIRSQLLFTIHI